MPEFSKIFNLPAARLSREEVRELGRLISDGLTVRPEDCHFSVSVGDAKYVAPSVDELLNQGLPRHIDSLSFDIWSRAKEDNDTAMSISVGLSRTRASCYITSNNEVWFRGKIQQINEFFERRRLWYDKLGGRDKIPAVFGGLDAIVLVSIPIFLGLGKYLIAIIAGISAFIISRCYKAFLQGRLFPETDIGLFEERPRLSREVLMLIFAGVAAVGTATTVLIKIIEMGGP